MAELVLLIYFLGSNPFKFKMFYKLYLDRKKRVLFFQFEKLYIICKYIDKCDYFSINNKIISYYIMQEFPRNCSLVRIHNFCIDSGRSRGIFTFLGISRIRLRELINSGKLPGFYHLSW